MIGCYAVRNNPFDCMVCLVLGILAYFLNKAGYNLTCIVMGLVLGSTFESEMRRTLIATHNDWSIFLRRPISGVILGLCAVVVVWTAYKQIRASKNDAEKACQHMDS
jgi:putative tricarboxylic transport membrane protein